MLSQETVGKVAVALVLGVCGSVFGAQDMQVWTAEDYFSEAVAAYSSSTNVETSIIVRRRVRKADSNDCPRVEVPAGETKRIRWIGAPGLRNVRDVGGWTGLRAGRVYRGSALMWAEQTNVAYAVEFPMTRDVLVNRLGIRAELDLRGDKERKATKDGIPRHGLPEFGIRPVYVPLGGYMDAFKGTNAYRRAMLAFADPANFPIYVHCAGGADRTGTVIFLLEALCGVPEWQMDIDYEITSMAYVFGRRSRTDTGKLCYKSFKDTLKERYVGTTVNEKVEDYCRRTLGLTDDEVRSIRRNLQRPHETVPGFVLAEAEDFDDFGKWRLDSQFTHKMGSAYLIAPGVCSLIGSARTTVDLPQAGRWRAWVRTKDWLPEFSPGAFALSVGGTRSRMLGTSRRDGWRWEDAGTFELGAGPVALSLDDLSGAFARCDAVLLTTDLSYVPPEDGEALAAERTRLAGLPTACADRGTFDVVVVGAGPAGVPAAIAAARGGAKVALVGDRPVLGGNASDEIGVNMCGAAITHVTARETGIAEEAVCERTRHPGPGMSHPYRVLAEREKNLTVFYNERVTAARAEGGRVLSVDCRNTLTGARSRLSGKLFVDATGDGWLGYFAGAEYREGRESRKELGETCAPDEPDKLTMSGLLHEPGIGVCYRAEETDGPVAYQTPRWARVLPEGFERPIFNLRGQWWIEHSGLFDDCADPERARDELIRISFAYWGWLKNESKLRDKARNFRLEEIPVLTGRREARRLMGDYILTEHDCLQARVFPDAVAYGGWPLDTHDPMGMSAPKSDGYWKDHPDVPIYTIPYRCLYSKNVANLFMAGRDISGTHIAMGSARVQQTCSVVGQAVGTAAALCLRYGLSPRELGQTRIGELQQQLMRDDAYIPGFANADPLDLARKAKVSASSSVGSYARPTPCARRYNLKGGNVVYTNATPSAVIDGIARGVNGEAHAWVSGPGLPQWIRLDFPEMIMAGEVRLTFDTNLEPRALPRPTDPALVRAYDLEGSEDGTTWFPLATEEDNYRRLCVHRFAPRRVKAIRLTVRKTYGAQQAFVNEIRVYAGGRAAWMREGVGIMVHWLFPSYRDVDRWTDKFDVDAFLRDFRETGADWLVFTSGQCRGAYASPNEAFDRQCGEGHTPRRDLLLEIAQGVKGIGKRFIVYSAVDFVKDGCDDHSMQRGLCWDVKGVDRREFERRWSEVLGEWSLRLGKLCDGWWLDGCSEVQYPQGVTWPLWLDRCRAGNPLAAVAFNGGANRFDGKWGPSDYTAGETASLVSAEEVVGKVADEPECQRHYLFPLDGYWGGFWAWPKGAWARTEELQRTRPELFDQKHLDAMLVKREFPRPIYTPERLRRFLTKARQAGSAVTINVGISPEGRLNPQSVKLISSARTGVAAAEWITHPDMAGLKPRNVLARQLERDKLPPVDTRYQNRHYLFRRSFELDTVGKATLRITADDYYKLYVNGAFVAMGPAAGTTDCTYYNTVDLTPYLVKGRNTIALHTYYQGLVNRVWVSGDNRHGLWLELDADGRRVLASDASFKVTRHTGYSAIGKAGYDTQFLECYDAGAPEVGFERPDFDDAAWISAVRHPLGGDYHLVEQPSPMVVTEPIAPVSTERLADGALRVDFGGVYVGGVTLVASGKKGDAIGIRCGQELNGDGSVRYKLRANCTYVEKMVLSGGPRDVLNQYDYKSFRYLELLPSPGVTIDPASIRLVARHQPFVLKAKPTFADPALKSVWDLCVNSFRYGVQEQIMDCMEREKGYYLGDGCYTMLAYCLLTQDWRQARKFFDDFLRMRKVDRGLVTCANCSFMQEIAEYPFMMMLFAHWYLEQTGDVAFVAERFDALADVVDSYRERYARPDGLLVNLDKWCVVEWPKNFQDGYDADVREGKVCTDVHNVINAWYVIAVRSLNAIARRLGRRPYADMQPLEKAFRAAFWDGRRHLFVDREGSTHVSLPGNVYAQAGRLAPVDDPSARTAFLALVKEKGYASISLFQFFPLFCQLQATGEQTLLHDLLASPEAWLRNVREGGTRTFEGWGRDTKWNTSLYHLTIASAVVFLTDVRLSLP